VPEDKNNDAENGENGEAKEEKKSSKEHLKDVLHFLVGFHPFADETSKTAMKEKVDKV
jgi:hypothetical protein